MKSSPSSTSPAAAAPELPPDQHINVQGQRIYTVGTLSYNKTQLLIVFFWLMWNDFGIELLEKIGSLNSIMMKDHYGATYKQMALIGLIGGIVNPFINPWVSTWSDRTRHRLGRRRPFLFFATPIFAALMMCTPFMPDLFDYLDKIPAFHDLVEWIGMDGHALMIGLCGMMAGFFNAVVLAIFSYLYWDVVPSSLMGRFNGIKATVAMSAGLVWNFYIFGLAGDGYWKEVYVCTGLFSLSVYMLSTWMAKEGEYPPPDEYKKTSALAPIKKYFKECFSHSYYLWIFGAHCVYQIGNHSGQMQFFYRQQNLRMDLHTLGECEGWSSLITFAMGIFAGYKMGSLVDKLRPVRLIGPCYMVTALVVLWSYFHIRIYPEYKDLPDPGSMVEFFGSHPFWSDPVGCGGAFFHWMWDKVVYLDRTGYLGAIAVRNVVNFFTGITIGAFTILVFPREKIGQFCSAQAVFHQFFGNILNPFIAALFDKLEKMPNIEGNRLGYIWMAFFYFIAGLMYVKVYYNWKARDGVPPVTHDG